MANPTKKIVLTEQEKRHLRGVKILARLEQHYSGEITLTKDQLKAAEIILKYTLPTYKSHTLQADIKADLNITKIENVIVEPTKED